jgi:hypothetical protein
MSLSQSARQFVPNISASCVQSFDALGRFLVRAGDVNKHARELSIRCHLHFVHGYKPNPGIAQLTFDQSGNFFPQRLAQPAAMIFLSSVFHFPAPYRSNRGTLENTPTCQACGDDYQGSSLDALPNSASLR